MSATPQLYCPNSAEAADGQDETRNREQCFAALTMWRSNTVKHLNKDRPQKITIPDYFVEELQLQSTQVFIDKDDMIHELDGNGICTGRSFNIET